MDLYLLRHGKAGPSGAWPDDAFRALTDDGHDEMKAVGKRLRALGVEPEAILTSPLTRARQTAEIVADALGRAGVLRDEQLLSSGARPGDFQKALSGYASVMAVGHEPDLSAFVYWLTGADVEMKKGGLARVQCSEIEPGAGTLVWLLPPRVMVG